MTVRGANWQVGEILITKALSIGNANPYVHYLGRPRQLSCNRSGERGIDLGGDLLGAAILERGPDRIDLQVNPVAGKNDPVLDLDDAIDMGDCSGYGASLRNG